MTHRDEEHWPRLTHLSRNRGPVQGASETVRESDLFVRTIRAGWPIFYSVLWRPILIAASYEPTASGRTSERAREREREKERDSTSLSFLGKARSTLTPTAILDPRGWRTPCCHFDDASAMTIWHLWSVISIAWKQEHLLRNLQLFKGEFIRTKRR